MPLYRGCTFGCAAQLHGHVCCVPFCINTSADLPVRATLQCHGRLARPLSLPVHAFAVPYNIAADSSVCSRGWLSHDWFQLHHGDRQLCGDNYWPDASGEIHPVYFILYIAFFTRAITLACKFSSTGQVISLRYWMTHTGLYHGQIWGVSRQPLE